MGFPNAAQVIRNPSTIIDAFKPFEVFINDIRIDVLSSERINYDFDITSKPVETGLPVTDSRMPKPAVLSIEGLQSDDVFAATGESLTSLLNGIQSWQDKKDRLLELKDQDQVVIVSTPMGIYTNMLIQSFNSDRTAQNAYENGFIFRMVLREVRFVSSDVSSIDKSQIPESLVKKETEGNKTAEKRKVKKKKKTKKTPVEPSEKKKSIALGIVDAFTGG